jgi:hypothetical protein
MQWVGSAVAGMAPRIAIPSHVHAQHSGAIRRCELLPLYWWELRGEAHCIACAAVSAGNTSGTSLKCFTGSL